MIESIQRAIESILTVVPPWLILLLVIFNIMLGAAAYLILLERKVASWVQDRIGPNRVGPRGLLQPIADGIKMFLKEDFRSPNTDRWLFSLAPVMIMLVVFTAVAIIPWGGIFQGTRTVIADTPQQAAQLAAERIPAGSALYGAVQATDNPNEYVASYRYAVQIADINLGVLLALAVLSLVVYAVVFAGWASNNKYSFLGGMRAAAQMISYEVPLGLSVLTIVLMFGTLSLTDISAAQSRYWAGFIPAWNIFCQPVAFLMFLICLHAEANRAPFDLAEAEQELVGGYHTEYSSMRLGLLLMGEYIEMVVTSGILVALFLGGWHFPGLTGDVDPSNSAVTSSFLVTVARIGVYLLKIFLVIGVFMWVRWSLPRFRYDQLMNLSWRALVPISLFIMLGTGMVVFFFNRGQVHDAQTILQLSGTEALAMLGVNVLMLGVFAVVARFMPTPDVNRRMSIPGSRFGNDRTVAIGNDL